MSLISKINLAPLNFLLKKKWTFKIGNKEIDDTIIMSGFGNFLAGIKKRRKENTIQLNILEIPFVFLYLLPFIKTVLILLSKIL